MSKRYDKKMSHAEFKKYMEEQYERKNDAMKASKDSKRKSYKVKGSAKSITKKSGWYDDNPEHSLAAHGIKTAINDRKKGKPKTVVKSGNKFEQPTWVGNTTGPDPFFGDRPNRTNLERMYLEELRDTINNANLLYEKGEITSNELDRRIEICRLTANYIDENKLSEDDLTDLMRQSNFALKDPNKQYFFYYNIGKEWKGDNYNF